MSVIPFTLHNNTLTLCAKQHSNAISVKSDMKTKLTLLIGCTNTLQITFCKETLLHLVPQYAHGGVEKLLIVLTMIIVSVNKNSLATIILLPTSAWLCQPFPGSPSQSFRKNNESCQHVESCSTL